MVKQEKTFDDHRQILSLDRFMQSTQNRSVDTIAGHAARLFADHAGLHHSQVIAQFALRTLVLAIYRSPEIGELRMKIDRLMTLLGQESRSRDTNLWPIFRATLGQTVSQKDASSDFRAVARDLFGGRFIENAILHAIARRHLDSPCLASSGPVKEYADQLMTTINEHLVAQQMLGSVDQDDSGPTDDDFVSGHQPAAQRAAF